MSRQISAFSLINCDSSMLPAVLDTAFTWDFASFDIVRLYHDKLAIHHPPLFYILIKQMLDMCDVFTTPDIAPN